MKDQSSLMFNYDCEICGKNTAHNDYKRFPVFYKPENKNILVCGTCFSIIGDNGEFSTFKIVKEKK